MSDELGKQYRNKTQFLWWRPSALRTDDQGYASHPRETLQAVTAEPARVQSMAELTIGTCAPSGPECTPQKRRATSPTTTPKPLKLWPCHNRKSDVSNHTEYEIIHSQAQNKSTMQLCHNNRRHVAQRRRAAPVVACAVSRALRLTNRGGYHLHGPC